jgi:lipopolysaccharide export system permease protein
MTRIDRYILLLYSRILMICLSSIIGLLIIIHFFGSMNDFNRLAEQRKEPMIWLLFNYYRPFAISVFERLGSLMALLALLFTVAWLNKTNELTALLAAGISKRRVVKPLLMASAVVIFGTAVLRETVIPQYQDHLDRKPGDLTGQLPRPIRPAFDHQSMSLIQGRHLVPIRKEIAEMSVRIQGGPLSESIGNRLVAKSGLYQPANDQHPAGYLLVDVQTPRGIDTKPSVKDPESGNALLLTAHDNPWLKPGSCFLASTIEYETLRGGSSWQQYAGTRELIAHLQAEKKPHSGNELRVNIHQRFVRPAVDWTALLLGMPLLLRRPDRHMFWVAGVTMGIVGGFSACVMGLAALGASGYILSPWLAAWLPLLVFLPWGLARSLSAMES